MHKERLAFFKIFITLGLLISLPLVFILTNSPTQKQDIRSRAKSTTPTPAKIIFVPFSFSKDKDDDYLLDFKGKARIRNGFVPPVQTTTGPQFTAEIFSMLGQKITTRKFSLPQVVAIDGLDKTRKKEKAELKKVTRNNQGLILPYHPNASFLLIKDSNGEIIANVSIKNLHSDNNIIDLKEMRGDKKERRSKINPWQINKAFAGSGTLNIAILGDNYNGDNLHFQNDVNDIVAGLLSIEPFKSNAASIVFYPQLSAVPLCSWVNSALSCNDTLSLQEASSIPYDKIYVLYNGPYAGYAYLGATLAYGTNATDMPTSVKQGLFIHELAGHVIGGLMDEYSYGTTGLSYAPNCSDSSSCPSWSAISGLGCFATCGFTNLFRATDNSSVMNTAILNGILTFDPFSTQIVNGKLTSLLGTTPPTPTLPPVVHTLTNTPVPSPTTAPTPLPTTLPTGAGRDVTSSSQFTGTSFNDLLSVTPVATITPSPTTEPIPTQPAGCSFPNFCTKSKYCGASDVLPISCASENRVCCKVQIQSQEKETQVIEVTLTPLMEFEPLPAIPVSAGSSPTPILLPTITAYVPMPTTNQAVFPQADLSIATLQTTQSSPTPTFIIPTSIPPTVAQSISTPQDYYRRYETPTPYKVEEIVFERATPTPKPKLELVDILSAPSRFINNLVKNFFSIFRRN